MAKLIVQAEPRRTVSKKALQYTFLRLEGLIDAPNFLLFEAAIDKVLRSNASNVVLDLRKVQYINSTGISSIIRLHDCVREKSGALVLIHVSRTVGLTMHLLGITSIVPFLKSLQDAEDYLENRPAEAIPELEPAFSAEGTAEKPVEIPVLREPPLQSSGTVVVAVPQSGPFTDILRRRLRHVDGDYHLVHTTDGLLERLDRWDPDIVLLDHRLPGADQCLEKLKVESRFSLTSVIILYEQGRDVGRVADFRIWENDYLVDPFELMNLFVLTESELRRVPRDKRLFSQQVRFEFCSDRSAVEKALRLAQRLIRKLGLSDTDITALYASFKEAVDNAVLHGNKHDPQQRVDVNFLVDPNKVTFIIEDQGDGFDYEYYMAQIDSAEAFEKAKQRIRAGGRGGLGILLMYKCTDRLEYSGAGNIVRLEKNLPR